MINTLKEFGRNNDCDKIIVYPSPYSIYGDSIPNIKELYRIYHKLGFLFTDKNPNTSLFLNEMTMAIEK